MSSHFRSDFRKIENSRTKRKRRLVSRMLSVLIGEVAGFFIVIVERVQSGDA
jgi:hypothetical protein